MMFIDNLFIQNENWKTGSAFERLENISPLTKEVSLSVFKALKKDFNVIISYPDNIFAPLSVICGYYADLSRSKQKDIMVYSHNNNAKIDENPQKFHIRNFSRLTYYKAFLYEWIIPFEYNESDNSLIYCANLNLIKNRKYKRELKKRQIEAICNDKIPSIIFSGTDTPLNLTQIDWLKIGNRTHEHELKFDFGLIVFENMDRLIHNEYNMNIFLEWLNNITKKETKLLFHFSNPYNKFIREIKEKTNSLLYHCSMSFLHKQKSYFENVYPQTIKSKKLVRKYNLDSPDTYEASNQIIPLKPIATYDFDKRLRKCRNLFYNLKTTSDDLNKTNYYSIKHLLYTIKNMAVKPKNYTVLYYDKYNDHYYYITVIELLRKLKALLADKISFVEFANEFESLVEDLSISKDITDPNFSNPKTKNNALVDFTLKIIKYRLNLLELTEYPHLNAYLGNFVDKIQPVKNVKDYSVIIGVQTSRERNMLYADFNSLAMAQEGNIDLIKRIKIYSLKQLTHKRFIPHNVDLLLTGSLALKNFQEYFRGYDNIFVVSYKGKDYDSILEHIDIVERIRPEENRQSLRYIHELKQKTKMKKPDFLEEYDLSEEKISIRALMKKESKDIYGRVRDMVLTSPKYSNAKDQEEEVKEIETITNKISQSNDDIDDYDMIISLENMDNGQAKTIKVKENWSFLCVKDKKEMKLEEKIVDELTNGDFLILLDQDEKRSFFDFIIDTFNLEEGVDVELVSSWKHILDRYVTNNEEDSSLLYQEYEKLCCEHNYEPKHINTFRNWIKGNVIGTRDPEDIYILGLLTGNEKLVDQYKHIHKEIEELWKIRRLVGKKINKIVGELLGGSFNQYDLNYEESIIYDKITIYSITSLEHVEE